MGTDTLNDFDDQNDRIMIDTSVFGEDVRIYDFGEGEGLEALLSAANITDTNAAIFLYYDTDLGTTFLSYAENASAADSDNSYTFVQSSAPILAGNVVDQTGSQIAVGG
jgi:hypothetical protein